jgi:ubiquinone/menaquinone biosynthesis C-methylase UbiE
MTTNYDPIAEQYKRSKLQPWRTHIEAFSLMTLVGDLTGLSVVDVACGEGFYTRLLCQKGASKVTGVDLSGKMIELARKQEAECNQGIVYLVGDARLMTLPDKYDVAVSAYLLNYARNRVELQDMCAGVARCLRPGGRFVTVNSSPALDFSTSPSYRKYGFETSVVGKWQEGAPIKWTFFLEDSSFEIENYHLDVAAHEEALNLAGFATIRWHTPRLSTEGNAAFGNDFWAGFLNYAPITLIECRKG